mgnify:CR=1 FL=1
MRCRWILPVLLLILVAASPSRAQVDSVSTRGVHAAANQAAQAAAQEWLRHLDAGRWSAAWEAAAPGLRDTVAQEGWKQRGVRTRNALGPVRSRKLVRTRYHDTLPQTTTPGPYVLLQYHATFGMDLYVETVLAAQTDEAWQVAGYEVAPAASRRERDTGAN